MTDATPGEHLGGHAAHTAQTDDGNAKASNFFILGHDAHLLEGHETTVGIFIGDLTAHVINLLSTFRCRSCDGAYILF